MVADKVTLVDQIALHQRAQISNAKVLQVLLDSHVEQFAFLDRDPVVRRIPRQSRVQKRRLEPRDCRTQIRYGLEHNFHIQVLDELVVQAVKER